MAHSKPILLAWAWTLALVAVGGCGDKDDTGAGFDATTFSAGSFQFTSTSVTDGCLDGAFSVLFLPEGAGTESDWAYPVELPAWDSLPASYTIQLQAPFSDMAVTVEEGGTAQLSLDGAQQLGVEFNADSYPGCLVDLGISAELDIDNNDALTGTASMQVDNPTGETCPAFTTSPCALVLDFTATRL